MSWSCSPRNGQAGTQTRTREALTFFRDVAFPPKCTEQTGNPSVRSHHTCPEQSAGCYT